MEAVKKPPFVRRMARAELYVAAVSAFLERIAHMLRRLVQVFGWLVLLYWTVRLPFRPELSVAHLLTPGGGVLAVVQGIVKRPRWTERANKVGEALESEPAGSGGLADMDQLIEDADATRLRGSDRYRLASSMTIPTFPAHKYVPARLALYRPHEPRPIKIRFIPEILNGHAHSKHDQ